MSTLHKSISIRGTRKLRLMRSLLSTSERLRISSMKMRKMRKRFSAIMLFSLPISLFILYLNYEKPEYNYSRYFNNERVKINNNYCKSPNLPINNPEIMKYIVKMDPITCSSAKQDLIITNSTHAFLRNDDEAAICEFSTIQRDKEDMSFKLVKANSKGNVYKFENDDFVKASCKLKNAWYGSWSGYYAVPRRIKIEKSENSKSSLNVLIWGHDSLSKNMFIRQLPKTFNYMKNELQGIILEKYNIIGDGTPQALIPILTGKTEFELPETRKRMSNASFVNVYPFIWNEYKKKGYITAYNEDCPHIGTFTYRLMGFNDQPTDHYIRPYFLAAMQDKDANEEYCQGSVPRHMKMINYFKDILANSPEIPKFLFNFHSELSHDNINAINGADSDIYNFVQHLKLTSVLDKSILIFMSDHGHRFTQVRKIQQGKQEERMPMFIFIFPPWFSGKYPKAYRNFLANSQTLANPFDIHATLQDILNLDELPESHFDVEVPLSREMSLFQKIPSNRNCEDAGIENHWCACLEWFPLNNDLLAQRVASEFVKALNKWTSSHSDICARLEVSRVLSSTYFTPTTDLLKFLSTSDHDGRVPDLTDEIPIGSMTIQIKVETKPGLGHFEVSAEYNLKTEAIVFKESDISRIDKYGFQAKCVDNADLENLRKYCYCV